MSDKLDQLDKLLSLVPIPRLECPACGNRQTDPEGEEFDIVYTMVYTCPIRLDAPSRIVEPQYDFEQFDKKIDEKICCLKCYHQFDPPEGWNIITSALRKKQEKVKAKVEEEDLITAVAEKNEALKRELQEKMEKISTPIPPKDSKKWEKQGDGVYWQYQDDGTIIKKKGGQ